MEDTDIRIGNMILVPRSIKDKVIIPSVEMKVKGIIFGMLHFTGPQDQQSIEFPAKLCSGIPLTEEWLKKFNLERTDDSEAWSKGSFRVFPDWNGKQVIYNSTCLEYVHQLQNLYFALTGKEL